MLYNSYQVAEIIGVNVSTIKRWTSSGKLNCHQTNGGHRKFHLRHLKDFFKKNKNDSININLKYLIGENKSLEKAINEKDYKTLIKYCFKSSTSSSSNNFTALNNALILNGYSIDVIFDQIIIPTLTKIGQEWSNNNLTITEEHLASERIKKFILSLESDFEQKRTKFNAFFFTLAEDNHDLPTYMAEAITNQNKDIKTFNLGANIPANDFIKISKKIKPKIIFISIIYIKKIELVKREINLICKNFNNPNIRIILSGAGVKEIKTKQSNLIKMKSFKNLKNEISFFLNN
ncbi:MAG: hypothetical protein CMG64_04165 [Candidatus Marinimicrobia bacterium]|nr:hypothetical protein [Candidatus Neomarinimicrobiota bacterium]|tara:strand:+ start:1905 stop:2774 length:870 start_codon:yes stop_codon:yes gene_type:complete